MPHVLKILTHHLVLGCREELGFQLWRITMTISMLLKIKSIKKISLFFLVMITNPKGNRTKMSAFLLQILQIKHGVDSTLLRGGDGRAPGGFQQSG